MIVRSVLKSFLSDKAYDRLKDVYLRRRLPPAGLTSTEYWSRHHVTLNEQRDAAESRRFIRYRRRRYIGITELMPTAGHDGKTILDYGCGPGIESAAFGLESKGITLICADVSAPAIAKAKSLLALHNIEARFIEIAHDGYEIDLQDGSVDLIHCSGVLHHTKHPVKILSEFSRLLRVGGEGQIMVYNYDCLYMHLYVSYLLMIKLEKYGGLRKREVFRKSTDGPNCPISEAWSVDEFMDMCRRCNLAVRFKGAAFDCVHELGNLQQRFAAIYDEKLHEESRDFLYALTFDERGLPLTNGRSAGMYACFHISKHAV